MTEPPKIGFTMYVLAAIVLLALLTGLFSGMLEHRQNPNSDPESEIGRDGKIKILLQRNADGHYVATGTVNGKEVVFMLDTGATAVAVPLEFAKALSLTPGRQIQSATANGYATVYTTMIDELRLGDIIEHQIPATLVPNLPGEQILLGMSFLKRLDFSQRGEQLIIESYPK